MTGKVIEFEGVLCKESLCDRRGKTNYKFLILSSMILLVGIICTIIFGIRKDEEFYPLLICTIVSAISIFCCSLPLPKYRQRQLEKLNVRSKITFQNEKVTLVNAFNKKDKSIAKIKKVIDMGEWYYLIFKFGDISNSWICQKDLITKGTIEEFEKLFEDKIIRKAK